MSDDEHRPRETATHRVGEVLDQLSVDELEARIALLQAEIARLEAAKLHRQKARDAAASIFGRS